MAIRRITTKSSIGKTKDRIKGIQYDKNFDQPLFDPSINRTLITANNTLQDQVDLMNQINNLSQINVDNLTFANSNYESMNDLLNKIQNEQQALVNNGSTTVDQLTELVDLHNEMFKLVKNYNLGFHQTNIVQAEINDKLDKSVKLATEFRNLGIFSLHLKQMQPFVKGFKNVISQFSDERNKLMKDEIAKLRASGEQVKIEQAAILEVNEGIIAKLFKVFETFASMAGKVLMHFKDKLMSVFSTIFEYVQKFKDMLLKIPGIFFEISKSAVNMTKELTEHFLNMIKSITAVPLNMLEKVNDIGYEIKKDTAEFQTAFENIQKDLRGGSFIGRTLESLQDKLIAQRKQFNVVSTEFVHMFGTGVAGINKALQETTDIVKSLGIFSSIFAQQISKNTGNALFYFKMKQALNATDEDLQYISRRALNTGKSLATVYTSIQTSINDAADAHRQDSKSITKDYLDMRKNVIDFGHITDKELGHVVGRLRQMGVEMKDVQAIFQKIQTFEDAANMSSQLSQSFNMVVDSMDLLMASSPDQIFQMLRDSMFATGRSFKDLNRFEKALMQQTLGISSETLQTLFEFQNINKTYDEIIKDQETKDPMQQQIKSINAMKDAIVELKQVMPKFQNSFDAFFTGIKDNALLSADLKKNFEDVSLSFDGLYTTALNLSGPFLKALTPLLKTITNIKNTLTDARFQKDLISVVESVSKIVNVIFSGTGSTGPGSFTLSTEIGNIIDKIIISFDKVYEIGYEIVTKVVSSIISSLPTIFSRVMGEISRIFSQGGSGSARGYASILLDDIKLAFSNIVAFLNQPTTKTTLINVMTTLFSFSTEFFKIAGSFAKSFIDAIIVDLQKASTGSSAIINHMQSFANSLVEILIGQFTPGASGKLGSFSLTGLIPTLLGFDPVTGSIPSTTYTGIFKAVSQFLFKLTGEIALGLVTMADEFVTYFTTAISTSTQLTTAITDMAAGFPFEEIFKKVVNILTNIFADGKFVDILMDSISEVIVKINDAFKGAGSSISEVFINIVKVTGSLYIEYYKMIIGSTWELFGPMIIKYGTIAASTFAAYSFAKARIMASLIESAIIKGGTVLAGQISTALGRPNFTGEFETGISAQSKGQMKFNAISGAVGLAGAGLATYGAMTDSSWATTLGAMASLGATGAQIGAMFGPAGALIGGGLGAVAGGIMANMNDGFISKDGKIVKIHDDDNVVAFKENGPVLKSAGNQSLEKTYNSNLSDSIRRLTTVTARNQSSIDPDMLQNAIKEAMIEGFKNQNQKIEVKLNGEKVGEGLLASGLTTMASNANVTKGHPTINPESVIYRDGQLPMSGYNPV